MAFPCSDSWTYDNRCKRDKFPKKKRKKDNHEKIKEKQKKGRGKERRGREDGDIRVPDVVVRERLSLGERRRRTVLREPLSAAVMIGVMPEERR